MIETEFNVFSFERSECDIQYGRRNTSSTSKWRTCVCSIWPYIKPIMTLVN